jgi:hypothetical protein
LEQLGQTLAALFGFFGTAILIVGFDVFPLSTSFNLSNNALDAELKKP